jgi:hypothetical protein
MLNVECFAHFSCISRFTSPFQHFLGPWNALERFQKSVAGARRLRRFSVALQIHVEAG